jgi:hypothetical protein
MDIVKRMLWVALTFFLYWGSVLAQDLDTSWTRTYGGDDYDYGCDIIQTSDGGYIIAGSTASFGTGWWNIYLVKTDFAGDTLWTRYYDAEGPDWASSIQETVDGGYIIACDGFADLMKTDEHGDSVWTRNYGITANDVQRTSDGGYIVCGAAPVEGYNHSCLIKTNAAGDTTWYRYYIMGSLEDVSMLTDVQQTVDGNYIAAGLIYSNASWWDYIMIKADSLGDTLWTRIYGTVSYPEEAYAMQQTGDGGYIITGLYFWTVKTDAYGDTIWTYYYGAGEIGCAYSIQQTNDDGYIICGPVDPLGVDDSQLYLVKIDSAGYIRDERYYGTDNGWDYGQNARQTRDGGFIVTGWTDSFGAGCHDIWLLKIKGTISPYEYLPGDANMYNGTWPPEVVGSDVTYLVNYFRGSAASIPCLLDGFWASADANGDCDILGSDVTRLVNYFRGTGAVRYCPDYPPAWHSPAELPAEAPAGWPNCE